MPIDSFYPALTLLAALAVGILLTFLILRSKWIVSQQAAQHYHQRLTQSEQELAQTRERLDRTLQALQDERVANTRMSITLEQKQRHFDEQLAFVDTSREQLKEEFENLANEVLERKGKSFSEFSERNLTHLLQPMHAEMKGFRERIEHLHHQDTRQQEALRSELKNLQSLNREITDQAQRLTEALQGQKKIQGNWGELMLENVLDGSGLRRGTDYKREVSFNTEEGRSARTPSSICPRTSTWSSTPRPRFPPMYATSTAIAISSAPRPFPNTAGRSAIASTSWRTSTITTCPVSTPRKWSSCSFPWSLPTSRR